MKARNDMKWKRSKKKWQNYRNIENEKIKLCKLKTKSIAQNQNKGSLMEKAIALIPINLLKSSVKAVKIVKSNLLKSPRKQKFVATAIAKSVGLVVWDNDFKPGRSSKKISVECEMAVNYYFLRDDPGRLLGEKRQGNYS